MNWKNADSKAKCICNGKIQTGKMEQTTIEKATYRIEPRFANFASHTNVMKCTHF